MQIHRFFSMLVFGAGLVAGSTAMADGAAAASLFGDDAERGFAHACFVRHYTTKHMAGHPQQNVTDMLAYVQRPDGDQPGYHTVALGVEFRALTPEFQVSGSCSAPGGGKGALSCGIECDGGHIGVRIRDEKSILIDIPDGARVWDPAETASEDGPPDNARFGSDDKLFRLDRTDIKDCLPLVWDEDVKKRILAGR